MPPNFTFECIENGPNCGCDENVPEVGEDNIYIVIYRREKHDPGTGKICDDCLDEPPLKKRKLNEPPKHRQAREVFKYLPATYTQYGTAYSDEDLCKIGITPDSSERFYWTTMGAITDNDDTTLYYSEEFRRFWDCFAWKEDARKQDLEFREKYLCRFVCRQCKPDLNVEQENERLRAKRTESTRKVLSGVFSDIRKNSGGMPQEIEIFDKLLADMITE